VRQPDFGCSRRHASGLEIRVVLKEPFVVALPDDHPLAAQPSIRPADLQGCPAFVLARRYAPGFHDEMLVALKREGADLGIAQELGEFTTMLALVAAGLGIGMIPAEAAIALLPKVVARPLELSDHRAGIGLAYTDLDNAAKRALLGVMHYYVADAHEK